MTTQHHPPQSSSGAIAQTSDHRTYSDALTEQAPDSQTIFDHDLSPPMEPDHPLFLHPIQAQGVVTNSHRYEDEADMMARQVMTDMHHSSLWSFLNPCPSSVSPTPNPQYSQVSSSHLLGTSNQPTHQQFSAENHDTHQRSARSGHPLPQNFRRDMERYFQSDLSSVRIHTDIEANQLNREMQSYAIAQGQDILFRDGAYQPHRPHGQAVLIHELTHVMQQQSLRKQGLPLPMQCIKLKGRNALEIETEEIKRDNLDHLPDSIRLHMAHVIEILENAGNGKLWNEETQTFQPVADSSVSGPQAKKLRKRLRDQAQFLDTYRQENEPRPKPSGPELEVTPSQSTEQSLTEARSPHPPQPDKFDPNDPELDFLQDFEALKTKLLMGQGYVDIMIAAFQGKLKLTEKEAKKKIKEITNNPAIAASGPSLTLPPVQRLDETLHALDDLRTNLSDVIWSFTPETFFLRTADRNVINLHDFDEIQKILENIPEPGLLTKHYLWLGCLHQDIRFAYNQILLHQKARGAVELLEVSCRKNDELRRLTTQRIADDQVQIQAGQDLVEQYGSELKAASKSKKKRATATKVDRDLKNLVLDDSRKTTKELQYFISMRESYESVMREESARLLKAKQVMKATAQAEEQYEFLLQTAHQHFQEDAFPGEVAAVHAWHPGFLHEQDLLKHLQIYQSFSEALAQNLTDRLQVRRDWHSPSVELLVKLQADFDKARALLYQDAIDFEEAPSSLEDIQDRLIQEDVEFEELLQTWQRLDRSELQNEEAKIVEIQKWVRENPVLDLEEVTELRKKLGDLVGDRNPRTLRFSEEIYIEPEEWQDIHSRLKTLHRGHHKAVQTQPSEAQAEAFPSSTQKPYSWLDSSTWTVSSGGIEFLNGLTQAAVEQVDPKTIPKLLKDLADLNLYGQHKHFPVVGTVYHRHILNGEGGLAFTYRLAPDMTVTPCVVDISTHRPSQGTGK